MGFGIMFIGYCVGFIFFVGRLPILRAIGSAIMMCACAKLKDYNRSFICVAITLCLSLVFYGAVGVCDTVELLGYERVLTDNMRELAETVSIIFTFVSNIVLLWAMRRIAIDVQNSKIAFASVRNAVLYIILFVFDLITLLPFTITKRLTVVSVIFGLALAVANAILLFRAYAQICDEEDELMPERPSRFAFVNRMRVSSELRRAEAEKRLTDRRRNREKR